MYTSARIVQFNNIGSLMQGIPHLLKASELIKKFVGPDVSVLLPAAGGNPARALVVVRGESLDAMQAGLDRALDNAEYRAVLAQIGALVVGSATQDQMWKKIA